MKAEMGKTTDGTISYLYVGNFHAFVQKDGSFFFSETLQIEEVTVWELVTPGEHEVTGYAQVDGKQGNF